MDGKKVYKSMYEWLNMWAEQYGSHEALCDNKAVIPMNLLIPA